MLPELDKIKRKRMVLGLTQSRLSKEAGISQSSLTKIEKGQMGPSYNVAKKIFETLDRIESGGELKAGDKMCDKVISLSPDDEVGKAKKIMKQKSFSQIPVLKDGFAVGGVTEKDLAFSESSDSDSISSIMSGPFPLISEKTSLKAAKALLKENYAILIQRDNKIIGIITKADLL